MAHQTGRNILVAYKAESSFGTLPSGTSATVFRANSGTLNLNKSPIQSGENRRDGMMTRGRHGYREVSGGYTADLSVGTFDSLFEAVMRGTWSSVLTITQADVTSITVAANSITATSGSWITLGVKVGDVVRLSDHSAAANNNRNLRVTGVTATVLTIAETLTAASADTSFTLTRTKKLTQGLTARSFSVEEAEQDIDETEVFTGVRFGSVRIQMTPNGMVTVTFNGAGKDMQTMDGSNAPYFVSPTTTTTLGLTAVEAVIRLGGEDLVDLTALDLTIDLKAAGINCIGSVTTPNVFTNLAEVTMNITALREDLQQVNRFLDETPLELHILLTEDDSEPKDFFSIFVPNFTFSTSQKSEIGQDGPRSTSLTCLVGIKEDDDAYDDTMVVFQTSAS